MANQDPQKTFDDYSKLITDLDNKIKNLGGDGIPNLQRFLNAMGNDTALAAKQFELMSMEAHDLENVFGAISTTIKNVVADLDRSTKSTTLFKRGLSSVEGIARKLADHKSDESVLTIRQLGNLNKQLGLEIKNLKITQQKAIEEQKTLQRKISSGRASAAEVRYSEELLNYQKEIGQALFAKNSYLDKIVKHSEKEVQIEKEIQRTIGLTGLAFKGIAGTLQKIGVESQAIEDLNLKIRKTAKETGNAWKTAGTAISGTFKIIGQSLNDPAIQIAFITKYFKTLYEIGTQFSARTFEIQKTLGLSTASAKAMNEEFYSMQQSTSNIYANYKDLVAANFNLNESLGTSATFSAETLATQAKIMQVTGLTSEESAKIYEYSLLNGQTQEQTFNSMGKANKGVLSNKKVMQEVLKINGQLAAQYKNNPELLGKAVVQVQKLGITLEQAKNMASGLLNFEDSISSELEAELLTGQELNLEKARALALQGKSAEAAAEMLKQTGGLAKFQSMNVLQQDALAKSMGMSTDEMADSLVKAEKLNALGGSEKRLLDEKLTALKKAGDFEKASQLEKLVLQEKGVELAALELDTQAQIDKSVSSIKESLKSGIAGPLSFVTDKLAGVLADMAKNPVMKATLGAVGMIGAGAGLMAVVGAAMVGIKNVLVGSAIDRKQTILLEEIRNNTGGGGTGGSTSTPGGGGSSGTERPGGGIGSSLKRAGTAFKRGGFGAGMKSMGRMAKSGVGGLAKGGLRRIPMLGALLGAGMEFAEGGFNMESAGRAALSGGGAFLGGLGGAAAGGALGLGTGGVGAAAIPALTTGGSVGGGMAGDWLGDKIFGKRKEQPEDSAEDFIMRPGQKPLKFRKDDIIMGGTSLIGNSAGGKGEAKPEAVNPLLGLSTKLDQLINTLQAQKQLQVSKTGEQVISPLSGLSTKLDRVVSIVETQKTAQISKVEVVQEKTIQPIVSQPIIKPIQELKPIAAPVKTPTTIVPVKDTQGLNNTEIVGLLKELIAATKQGKPVYLDSNRVNAVLGQNMYTVGG